MIGDYVRCKHQEARITEAVLDTELTDDIILVHWGIGALVLMQSCS